MQLLALCLLGAPCASTCGRVEETLPAGKVGAISPAPAILGLKLQNSWYFCNFK